MFCCVFLLQFLLSSSVDESVRLWRVGSDRCLQVFPHSNYVTCVQFQPNDENFFISGSIDGKVRSWSVSGCQVVDWVDIREIVTAVAYSPDGKVRFILHSCSFILNTRGLLKKPSICCFRVALLDR